MRSIVFASGKGGVGKSTLALNLGILLAQAGRRCVVVDADLDMANISLMIGVELNPITLHNVLAGENAVDDAVYEGPNKLFYVPSSIHEEKNEIDFTRLRDAVSKLEAAYDYVLIDCPPGLTQGVQATISSAREVILVVTPEPPAVIDSLKIKRFSEKAGVKITGIVVNRVTGDKTELRPQDLESVLGIPVLASLPEDAEVRRSAVLQVPVVVRAQATPFSKALRLFASNLTREPIREEAVKPTLLQKIKAFFKKLFKKK